MDESHVSNVALFTMCSLLLHVLPWTGLTARLILPLGLIKYSESESESVREVPGWVQGAGGGGHTKAEVGRRAVINATPPCRVTPLGEDAIKPPPPPSPTIPIRFHH